MGQTPLFICGAALRAVRPLAGSRRSSPLAASLQTPGVTHPHARNIVILVASSGSLQGQSGGLDERAEGPPRRQAFIQK